MPLFQIRRGVLLQGWHPWSKQYHGWLLKAFGATFKWKHPESTVWFESSLTFTAFGFSRALWKKRFMPVVPQSASGRIDLDPEQAKLLKEAVVQNKLIFSAPHFAENPPSSKSVFWQTHSKWSADGKPDASWNERGARERAAAELDKLREERKRSCPPTQR